MLSLERIEQLPVPLYWTFYVRRAFRIYPLSILCVSAIVWFQWPRAPWWPWFSPDSFTVLTNLLLCTNLFYTAEVTSVLWSLPLEVQMYALLPILYLVGKKHGLIGVGILWGAAVIAGLILPHISGRLGIAAFAPCFVAGVAAYFLGTKVLRPRLPAAGWIGMIGGGFAFYAAAFPSLDVIADWALCLLLGVSASLFAELQHARIKLAAAWLARYSYGIYLTHLHALWLAFVLLKNMPLVLQYAVFLVAGLGIPVLLYHLVERPMIQLGARLTSPTESIVPMPAKAA
jgi:peptidoglycan/LPS O-acetylase OafA/YrhL